jgi:hypothetical protein
MTGTVVGGAGGGNGFLIGSGGEAAEVIARDVVMITDGGGLVTAALVPIHGADVVAKVLARAPRVAAGSEAGIVWLNGAPAGRLEMDGEPTAVSLTVENGGSPGSMG